MRLLFTALAATLLLPASAQAGTVALEGTELVFRSDPGQLDDLVVTAEPGVVTFTADRFVAGAGCTAGPDKNLRCPSAAVTAIRILAGDRSDSISARGPPTKIGRRWLRRNPRLPVFVYVRTRSGGESGLLTFSSRIG